MAMMPEASAVRRALNLGSVLQGSPRAASLHREIEEVVVLAEISRAAQEDPISPLPMPLVVGLEQLLLGKEREALLAVSVTLMLLAYVGPPGDRLAELRLCQVGASISTSHRLQQHGTRIYSLHGWKRSATFIAPPAVTAPFSIPYTAVPRS
jgi:hypothetical protein